MARKTGEVLGSVYTGVWSTLLKECHGYHIAKLISSTCICMHIDCIVCMTSVMSKGLYCSYPDWHCKSPPSRRSLHPLCDVHMYLHLVLAIQVMVSATSSHSVCKVHF